MSKLKRSVVQEDIIKLTEIRIKRISKFDLNKAQQNIEALEGNISEAAKHYRYFINQGFKDHIVFTNYGVILKQLGQLKEAELLQRKAIKINPCLANAHSNLGNLLRDLGNLKEAEISFRKAIEIKPDFVYAYLNLVNLLFFILFSF